MPKVAESDLSKINSIILEHPKEFIRTPNNELYCNLCHMVVKHNKQYFVDAHWNTVKHQHNNNKQLTDRTQRLLYSTKSDFAKDVLKAFLSADIPLLKLQNKEVKKLFQPIGRPLSSERTCRLRIDELYDEEIEAIKEHVKDQPMFLVVDEAKIHSIPSSLNFKKFPKISN